MKIVIWDHNRDRMLDRARVVYADAAAAAFVHARAANASAADPGPVSVPTSASRILTHIRSAIANL